MKKEEIYRLIEYNGVYNEKVKKNLKKLLKKYHPDHHGDSKVIKILLEVKKELESGIITYKDSKNISKKTYNDDLEYVSKLKKLYKEKSLIDDKLKKLYEDLSSSFKEYSDCYGEFCQLQNEYCNNIDILKQNKKIIKKELFVYLILLLIIVFCAYKHSIYIAIGIVPLLIMFLYRNFHYRLNIAPNNSSHSKKQSICNKKIKDIRFDINKSSEKINELKRDVQKINDNIRYFNNLLEERDDE